MKLKKALIFTLLVLASLVTLSNRCRTSCDRTMIVMSGQQHTAQEPTSSETETAGTSSLLRIAVTL